MIKLYSLFYKSFKLEKINRPRQSFAETFIPNGYCDIIKSENISKGFLHGSSVGTYVLDEFNSDMDNLEEFKNTENFLKNLSNKYIFLKKLNFLLPFFLDIFL